MRTKSQKTASSGSFANGAGRFWHSVTSLLVVTTWVSEVQAAGASVVTDSALWGAAPLLAVGFGVGLLVSTWVHRRRVEAAVSELGDRVNALGVNREQRPSSGALGGQFSALHGALEQAEHRIAESRALTAQLARGDFDLTPAGGDGVQSELTTLAGHLQSVQHELAALADAAQNGSLGVQGAAGSSPGSFGELIRSANSILDAAAAPVAEATRVLRQVEARCLTVRVAGAYRGEYLELGQALDAAIMSLERAFLTVSASSNQVASAASEITTGTEQLARSVTGHAASIDGVISKLGDVQRICGSNTTVAEGARQKAAEAGRVAVAGTDGMRDLSQAMEQIKASADETGKIIQTIDEIAFQTNLLALNAAVEAREPARRARASPWWRKRCGRWQCAVPRRREIPRI